MIPNYFRGGKYNETSVTDYACLIEHLYRGIPDIDTPVTVPQPGFPMYIDLKQIVKVRYLTERIFKSVVRKASSSWSSK